MRLFIAVNLPADVREGIWEAAESLREMDFPVRWIVPESLHLTLKFLGDVAEPDVVGVESGLETAVVGAKPFILPIAGFGAFPSPRRPRVVWVGCEGVPPLELLQHRLEQEMATLGFEVEGRPFRPHITLGRARRSARSRDFDGFEAHIERLTFDGEPLVDSVDLMESTLSRQGARYAVRHAAELAA